MNRRAAESDLIVYVNINLVAMDGGRKSHGHRPLRLRIAPPSPQRAHHAAHPFVHGPAQERAAHSQLAHGQGHPTRASRSSRSRPRSTTTCSRRPFDFLDEARREWTARDRRSSSFEQTWLVAVTAGPRKIFQSFKAPHEMTSVHAGEVEAVHEQTIRERATAATRPGRGSGRHPDHRPARTSARTT